MHTISVGVVLMSASLALPALGLAKESKPTTPLGQVVTIVGKNLCYGEVPATAKCDFRLPVPAKSTMAATHDTAKPSKDTPKTKAATASHPTTR